MKLKREHCTLFGNATLRLKGGVFFLLLFAGFCANAQVISINSVDPEAGEDAGNPASFTITRTPPNNVFNSMVTYSIDGTAEMGLDYTAPLPANNTVILSSTQPIVTIPLNNIIDDNLVEGLETIVVTLKTVNFGFISPIQNTVTLNLTDNDGIFTVSTVPTAAEQGSVPGSFTVNLDEAVAPGVTVSVPYTLTGTALGIDYGGLAQTGTLTFPAGGPQSRVITITPVDDQIVENDETVLLTLGAPTSNRGGGFVVDQGGLDNRTVTIADNDIGTFTVQTTDADAAEENQDQGRFLISLDKQNETGTSVTVPYTLGGGTAIASDYTANGPATPFTFPAGQLTNELLILPVDDQLVEGAETVILNLGALSNTTKFTYVAEPEAQRTVTIADNDCAAGAAAPVLNATTNVFCDAVSVNLDDYVDAAPPANIVLVWSTNPDPSVVAEWLPIGGAINAAGTYYGFFADTANNCYSPTLELVITQNTSPSAGTPVADQPTAVCSNQTIEFGPNQIDLANYITGQAAGAWTQSSGPNLGANLNGSTVDFRDQAAGTYEFTYTTNTAVPPCTNATSVVTLTVSDCDPCLAGGIAPVMTAGQNDTFCGPIPEAASLNDFTSSVAPAGTTLVWTSSDADFTDTSTHLSPADIDAFLPGDYYAVFYDAVNNCASPPLTISIKQNDIPVITTSTGNSRCGPGTLPLSATGSLDATLRWYTTATDGAPIRNGANFTTPVISQTTSYFVEAIANGCVSPRTEVVATVIPQPSAGVPENTSSCNAAEFGTTVLDLDSTLGGTPDEGVWSVTEGPSAVSLNAENIVDFQGSAGGSYIFTFTTTGAEAPCENASATVTISVSSCDTDEDGDGLLGGLEATLGTDPNNIDTDGDGINDGVEVGDDTENPLDEDEDGIIDALDSNILDTDEDGVNDQQDPANENACVPNRFNGNCDTDGDGISDLEEQQTGSDPDDPCSPNETPNCADPIDLQVLKAVDREDGVAIIGDDVVFTITVNNLSDRKAINVMVGDSLNTGFRIDSTATFTASSGDYDIAAGMWAIPEIAAMGSETLVIPVSVIQGDSYMNTAELLASIPADGNPDNDSSTVTLSVDLPEGIDLVLEKTAAIVDQKDSLKIADFQAGEVNPLIGQEIIFRLTVTNESNEDTVSGIKVLDSLFQSADNVFTYIGHTPTEDFNPTSGLWDIGTLLRNEVTILEIRGTVNVEGTFQNTAEISDSFPVDSEGKYGNNTSTITVNVSKRTEAEFGIIFNQFSPNNDGVNDDLKINKRRTNDDGSLGDEVDIQYAIKIFNRYGSLVFEGEQLTDEVIWDGTRKGKEVPDGTYFYVLDLTVNEEIEGIDTNSIKKGWIQLIR